MQTISLIRTRLIEVPVEHLFTTRDMLVYGTRGAVDQALNRLVRQGEISRIAPGVFVKPSVDYHEAAPHEIAMVKAHSWGKHNPKPMCPRCPTTHPG